MKFQPHAGHKARQAKYESWKLEKQYVLYQAGTGQYPQLALQQSLRIEEKLLFPTFDKVACKSN